MPGASDTIEILAPRQVVLSVITDYEQYPQFVPHTRSIRIRKREGNTVDVEMHIDMVKEVTYTIRLREEAPTRVSWTLVEGPFKSNEGGWELEDLGNDRTRATYRVDVNMGFFVPGPIVSKMVAQSLPANLKAFKARSEEVWRRQKGG